MGQPNAENALIVLDRTQVTAQLVGAVRWRARQRSYSFTLLVPQLVNEELFGDKEAERTLQRAIPVLEKAAAKPVTPMAGPPNALLATERALISERYAESSSRHCPTASRAGWGATFLRRCGDSASPVTVVRTSAARRPLHAATQFGGA